MAKLSVIITKKEASNIRTYPKSVAWVDEIIVADPCRNYATVEIFRGFDTQFYIHDWLTSAYIKIARWTIPRGDLQACTADRATQCRLAGDSQQCITHLDSSACGATARGRQIRNNLHRQGRQLDQCDGSKQMAGRNDVSSITTIVLHTLCDGAFGNGNLFGTRHPYAARTPSYFVHNGPIGNLA